MQNVKWKEYSVTVNLLIFLTLICIVGITRIVIIQLTATNTFESINVIEKLQYDSNIDMAATLLKVKNTMEDHYNISIYYGSVLDEIAPTVNANTLNDEKATFDMLQKINTELDKYPKGIVNEIQHAGYKVSIYLVDSFNNENVALANRTSSGYFNIFLSNSDDLKKAMHHEFYHILEYYIKLEFDEGLVFDSWDEYNPKDFRYSNDVKNISSEYVYGLDSTSKLHFVTLYSKFSEQEDRAETFSEMMTGSESYITNDKAKNIISKMDCITRALDSLFTTVDKDAYWQRYEVI